jgi:hypothetical protein
MSVKVVKFMSGEEIIATITNDAEKEGNVLLSHPARIVHAGQGRIGLFPYPPYGELNQKISVRGDFIALSLKPDEGLVKEYENDFVPRVLGLVVPNAGLKLVTD